MSHTDAQYNFQEIAPLSSISHNEQVFNAAKPPYQEALAKSGFDFELNYQQPTS